jgi:hypothetical protein
MTPRQFNFMRRFSAPSADASGRATRLSRTHHRTDGDQDGQIFRTGGASPTTQRRCTRRSLAELKQVETYKFDADGDEL